MPAPRPARGGGRRVRVAAERLVGFLDRLAERHGEPSVAATSRLVTLAHPDGLLVEADVPFPPLRVRPAAPYAGLLDHVGAPRLVGVVLVRRGGHAAGVFDGVRCSASKVGSRHVQGRTAAGGRSQQRFARRREGQARAAWAAAADTAAAVLLPMAETLDALVVGGDRSGCAEVLADPRLVPLAGLLQERRLDVPDPRLQVLLATPAQFRAVDVRIVDPPGRPGGTS